MIQFELINVFVADGSDVSLFTGRHARSQVILAQSYIVAAVAAVAKEVIDKRQTQN